MTGGAAIAKDSAQRALKAIDMVNAGEGNQEQMEFNFRRPYGHIALKEAVRGINAITKEAIRFGADREKVTAITEILIEANPIVVSAIDVIDDALSDD